MQQMFDVVYSRLAVLDGTPLVPYAIGVNIHSNYT